MSAPAVNTETGEIMADSWMTTNPDGQECNTLDELEDTIERGLHTFIEVGQALAEIRDRRLYRKDFDTFEAYCADRWNMSRSVAYDTIAASDAVKSLSAIADTPTPANLGQARELSGLATEPAAAVMREAHRSTNGNITAKAIREVRERSTARQAETDVAEFPTLKHYADQGKTADVVRLAGALREYDEPERRRRLETLDKTIAFEKRGSNTPRRHLSVAPTASAPAVDYAGIAYSVVGLANELADIEIDPTHLAHAITDDSLEHIENAITFLSNLASAVKEFE